MSRQGVAEYGLVHQHDRSRAPRANDARTTVALLLLLAGATLFCYRESFTAPFLFDDHRLILERPEVRDPSSLARVLLSTRRPVLMLSLAVNYRIGGFDSLGFHVFNFVVHLLAGWTLFLLIRDTLRSGGIPSSIRRDATGLALVTALIWLVHPLQTQSVTYIVQRCEAMMGLCFFLMLYCLLRGSRSTRSRSWYLGGVVAFALGIGSKEVMAAAIVVAPLYDRVFLSRNWREVFSSRRWFYLSCAVPLATLIGVVAHQSATQSRMFGGFGNVSVSSWEYLRSQPGVILHYLRLCLWPDRLCLDYDWPVADSPAEIAVSGSIVVLMLGASLLALRHSPRIGAVAVAFFLLLAPTSSFMPIVDLAFEHRMYVPLACVVLLAVLAVHRPVAKAARDWAAARVACIALVGLVVLALSIRTSLRNRDYLDPVVMWRDVVDQAPHNYKAYYNLGVSLSRQKRRPEAVEAYRDALRLRPRYTDARYNLALQLDALGRLEEAERQYERLLRTDPEDAAALFNLAGILHRTDREQEAIDRYRQTLRAAPDHLRARANLAVLLTERGDYAEARRHLEHAISLTPDKAWLHDHLGNLYARQGRPEQALRCYDQAVLRNGGYLPAYLHKAETLHELGRSAEAVRLLRGLRRRFPNSTNLNRSLDELSNKLAHDER